MQLTYASKRGLIEYLSTRANWRNVFDGEFFTSPWRKGNSRKVGIFDRFVNDSGNRVSIAHPSGALLKFELLGDKICIADEAGRQMVIEEGLLKSNWAHMEHVTPTEAGETTIDVPGTRICIRFKENGDRKIVFADWESQIELPFDAAERIQEPLPKGGQIHVVSISERQAPAFGLEPVDLLGAAKLVIAYDFGIEPFIQAFNLPEGYVIHKKASTPDPDAHLPVQWRRKRPEEPVEISLIQRKWKDTTQFEGYEIPLPRNFNVEIDDGGITVVTSLDQREAIWSQGDVYRNVTASDASPVQTVTSGTTAKQMLRLLGSGPVTRDKRGREWNYVLVKTKDSLPVSARLRGAVSNEFGLTARHTAILTFEQDLCILAMNSHVLEAAEKGSTDLSALKMRLIDEGLREADATAPKARGTVATVTPLRPRTN